MKTATLIYQDSRTPVNCIAYYPEDFKTPKEIVEWAQNFVSDVLDEDVDITVVSANPYVIEAMLAFLKNKYNFIFMINDKVVDNVDLIFKEFAEPMQELIRKS